jgi:hypothetical protein
MTKDEMAEAAAREGDKTHRRHYEPPTVTDFLQPIVALGTTVTTFQCATPRPPKH